MNYLKPLSLLLVLGLSFSLISCDDDESGDTTDSGNSIVLSGGPFTFMIDGTADNIPEDGITVAGESVLGNSTWVITNEAGEILGLPGSFTGPNFDTAGAGICFVWYLDYDDDATGIEVGSNASDIAGNFTLSNSITVTRVATVTLSGGPFSFDVGDGMADNIPEGGITVTGSSDLANSSWVVTDTEGNILGLPGAFTIPNFDDAGVGACYVHYIAYADGLTGLTTDGGNTGSLEGSYVLTNPIVVNREGPVSLSGGPFEFTVGDDTPDSIPEGGITVTGEATGFDGSAWLVTDDEGNILNTPPSFTAPDFDGAGVGVCYIRYIAYNEGLTGLDGNISELSGTYFLTNKIEVNRVAAQ